MLLNLGTADKNDNDANAADDEKIGESISIGDADNDFVSATKHSRWMSFALPEVRKMPFLCFCGRRAG